MARRKKGETWKRSPDQKDLRIADATREQVAKALMHGGAKRRPETRRPCGGHREARRFADPERHAGMSGAPGQPRDRRGWDAP